MGGFNGFGGFGALPAPPQVAPPPQPQQNGGIRNMGVMPYQQNPVASGMEAFGSVLQTIGQLKQQQKSRAMSDFQQGMALKAQGIPGVSDEKLAKYAKKAGLDKWIDFDHETPASPNPAPSPSQLGVAPAEMTSQAAPMAPPPVGPQGPPIGAPPPGVMSAGGMGGPSGPPPGAMGAMSLGPSTGNYPSVPFMADPVTGSYTQGPIMQGPAQQRSPGFMDRLKGGLSAVTGIGGGNVNPNSPGYAAVAAMGRNAAAQGDLQRQLGQMEVNSRLSDYREKMDTANMLHAYETGTDMKGNPLSTNQMVQLNLLLTKKKVFEKMDITDPAYLDSMNGGLIGEPGQMSKTAERVWQIKDPKGYKTFQNDLVKDALDRGMTPEDAETYKNDVMSNRPPSVSVPPSRELQAQYAKNQETVFKEIPGLEKLVQANPVLGILAQRGDISRILRITDGLQTKSTIEAKNKEREMKQADQRIGIEGFNASTSRINANTGIGNLNVNQENSQRQQVQQTVDTVINSGRGVKEGYITPEQQQQNLQIVSPNVRGTVSPYVDNWGPSNTPPQLHAAPVGMVKGEVLGQGPGAGAPAPTPIANGVADAARAVFTQPPQTAGPAPTGRPTPLAKWDGPKIVVPADVQQWGERQGIPYAQAVQMFHDQGFTVLGSFNPAGMAVPQAQRGMGSLDNR